MLAKGNDMDVSANVRGSNGRLERKVSLKEEDKIDHF